MSELQAARNASVWVLPLETGGCGATLQSIHALLAPRYAGELRARGVSFARSPRHADIVLIAGPLSQKAEAPVRRLLDAVPQPRALVAVGNCAIDGCVFAQSPHLVANPAEALDVHVEVGGCPPSPAAILEAITEAQRLLADVDGAAEEELEEEDVELEEGEDEGEDEGEELEGDEGEDESDVEGEDLGDEPEEAEAKRPEAAEEDGKA
jgi:Ni,Fe-hydrogenase III small subunit